MGRQRMWRIGMLFACLFAGFFAGTNLGRAATWHVEKWDMVQECSVTSSGVTYRAHLSKDGKEAWVFHVKAEEGVFPTALHFPKKIQKATVTKIGADMTAEPYDEVDFYQNVFGEYVEYAHGADGWCHMIKNVKTMTLPDTVREIDDSAFSGMRSLTKIKIPDPVTKLNREIFYGCEKLKEVELPKKLSEFSVRTCFAGCPKLGKVTIPKSNRNFVTQKDMLLSKDRKRLIWVFPKKKTISVPDTVNTIEENAFFNSQASEVHLGKSVRKLKSNSLSGRKIETITIDNANPLYAKDGQCIYRKDNGALVIGIAERQCLVISKKVKTMPKNATLCGNLGEDGNLLDVLDIASSVKMIHAECPVFPQGAVDTVYFRGRKPPRITGGAEWMSTLPIYCRVYVPKPSSKAYKKWYREEKCYEYIKEKDWHTF